MIPPHLPPPSSNIKVYKKMQNIKFIIVVTFLALIAGVTGASIMIGWVWPMRGEADRFTISYYRSTAARKQLEDSILQEIFSRTVLVYSNSSLFNGVETVQRDNFVGRGIVVSSDGWLVVYSPEFKDSAKNWRVVTNEGKSVGLEKAVYDQVNRMLFLKVSTTSSQYFKKQAEFVDGANNGDAAYVYDNNTWNYTMIESQRISNASLPHRDGIFSQHYILSNDFSSGDVVINAQGKVVGVVVEKNNVMPSSAFTHLISSVLNNATLQYRSLGAEGWFDSEQPVFINHLRVQGFFVDKIISKESVLKRGDVLMSIDNQVVDPTVLWYTIKNNAQVVLKIMRAGKIISVSAPVLLL